MGPAAPQPTLNHLRQTLAGIDPSNAPRLASEERLIGIAASIDRALGGGLPCGALHELAPTAPLHLGAASGFGLALAARASGDRRQVLWIATDFAAGEGGGPYGRSRSVRLGLGAAADAPRAEAGRCALGDGGGAALPRARLRHRRIDRRRVRGRSHRHAPPRARRARRHQRAELRLRPADPPPHHIDAERGGDPLGDRAKLKPARRHRRADRRHGPRAFRSFSSQEPARPVRPLDHRVGSS